ncbi:hypothetical protein [Flavobacterium sp.]|uniref:hypothetical protein n=1 Tax=Flavobacterium sp. TaxID=239 RepID=UPI00260BB790|nr:hypothetical protein [Flavobacterium sp.]
MSRLYYFKYAFFSFAAGCTTYFLVTGLFELDFDAPNAVWKWLGKSFFVGVVSGLILGILNAIFKYAPTKIFKQKP